MLVVDLLRIMIRENASDMFVTAGIPPGIKVDGKITPLYDLALTAEQSRDLTYSIMSEEQSREFESTRECNFAIHAPDIGRFRVNVFKQRGKVGMVLRKILTQIPQLEELHLPPILRDLVMQKRGLIIQVGGTGTGKSTTQASMVGYRNEHSFGHIVTVEDPIEYLHEHRNCVITQREVGVDTESFDIALKNAMRQAPDVIQIGEIRSRETMDNAIVFAETGHLCLATLHANNTYQALDRIINFFPEDRRDQLLMDLSMNLRALISQRLLPVVTGKGRVPAVEIMINTPLVSDLIYRGKINEIENVIVRSRESGMQSFDQSLFDLYEQGLVSYENVIKNATSQNNLRLRIKLESRAALHKVDRGSSMRNTTF